MCLAHRHLTVFTCIYACSTSDIRDILDSGSLSKLDLSFNFIGQEQGSRIKQLCDAKSIECTL